MGGVSGTQKRRRNDMKGEIRGWEETTLRKIKK